MIIKLIIIMKWSIEISNWSFVYNPNGLPSMCEITRLNFSLPHTHMNVQNVYGCTVRFCHMGWFPHYHLYSIWCLYIQHMGCHNNLFDMPRTCNSPLCSYIVRNLRMLLGSDIHRYQYRPVELKIDFVAFAFFHIFWKLEHEMPV